MRDEIILQLLQHTYSVCLNIRLKIFLQDAILHSIRTKIETGALTRKVSSQVANTWVSGLDRLGMRLAYRPGCQ